MWASINDSMLSSVHLFQSLRLCYSRRVRELLAVQIPGSNNCRCHVDVVNV